MRSSLRLTLACVAALWLGACLDAGRDVGESCSRSGDCAAHLICRDGACSQCRESADCPSGVPFCVPGQGCFECLPEDWRADDDEYYLRDSERPISACTDGQACRLGTCVYVGGIH